MKKILTLLFFQIIYSAIIYTQTDSIWIKNIEAVTVSAPKINTVINRTPLSIAKYTASVIQESQSQLSLQEYIYNTPGVFTMNANNYAQDLRVSIRGFGARSAFGIRGIKIIVDGIPETTPDGQGQVDNLNIGIVQNIEIIRGPASSLYGNASGGVISINTLNNFDNNYLKGGLTFGSFNLQQYQLTTGFKIKKTKLIFNGNRTSSDGYRKYNGFENNNFNARIFHDFSEKSKLNILLNYADSPKAEDPGGVDLDAVKNNREKANANNILFKAGEELSQFKIGFNYKYEYDKNSEFNTYAFYSTRDFLGKLPFEDGGIVDLSREYLGTGGNYTLALPVKNGLNKLHIGYEFAAQSDTRLRFNNLNGEADSLALEQLESFTLGGVYLIDHFSVNKWLFSFGIRHDWNKINVQDRIKENGDGSGDRTLSSWNPSLGINYELNTNHFIFTNFSTSFESPALSELSANPNSINGFNQLNPQKAINTELGVKGIIRNKLQYEVVLFHIDTKNELVPFELDTFPGRIFYRNTGKGTRNGLELSVNYQLNKKWNIAANYSFSDFIYEKYVLDDSLNINYNGNYLPGIPKHYGTISLNYINEDGLHAKLQTRYIGDLFTNDENSVSDEAYVLLNINVGYQIKKGKYTITPFIGANNLLNTKYNDNIRINAFGGRYYEPGPTLNFYGGVRINGEW